MEFKKEALPPRNFNIVTVDLPKHLNYADVRKGLLNQLGTRGASYQLNISVGHGILELPTKDSIIASLKAIPPSFNTVEFSIDCDTSLHPITPAIVFGVVRIYGEVIQDLYITKDMPFDNIIYIGNGDYTKNTKVPERASFMTDMILGWKPQRSSAEPVDGSVALWTRKSSEVVYIK